MSGWSYVRAEVRLSSSASGETFSVPPAAAVHLTPSTNVHVPHKTSQIARFINSTTLIKNSLWYSLKDYDETEVYGSETCGNRTKASVHADL